MQHDKIVTSIIIIISIALASNEVLSPQSQCVRFRIFEKSWTPDDIFATTWQVTAVVWPLKQKQSDQYH